MCEIFHPVGIVTSATKIVSKDEKNLWYFYCCMILILIILGVVKVYFHEENDDITCFALPVGYSDIKDAKQFKHCLQHMGIINEQTGDNRYCFPQL